MLKMKKILYSFLFATAAGAVASSSDSCSSDCGSSISQNLWQPHAFSAYSSVNLIQMKDAYDKQMEQDDKDPVFYFSAAGQYMQSFGNACKLGAMPFWSGSNVMTIGNNNGESDVDAYQFGMGDVQVNNDIVQQGTIKLSPNVQHTGVDMMFYYMQHKVGRGIVAKVDAPLGAMRIQSNLCENPALLTDTADLAWTPPYPAVANRPQTLTAAFQGGSLNSGELLSEVLHPVALYKGRISCCPLTAVRLADLSFTFGYNFVNEERGFLMVGFKTTCPTGNVPTGNFIFEPVFGRAGHWGVGGELSASVKVFENDCSKLSLWAQGEVLHLFNGRTPNFRSFDLKLNGKGSKYMLLQYYAAQNPDANTNPTGRVGSFITQAINVTTFPVKSNFGVEGSFALMLDYETNNWNAGIGGEVWGRTAECLSIDFCNALNYGMVNLNDYAVLGRQISRNNVTNTDLSYCEPLATINKSQDVVLRAGDYTDTIKDARLAQNRIPADVTEALDVCGAAAPRAVTGKVFGEVGYTWREHCHNPNLSLFGGAEFTDAKSNMINLWSVGLKGSFVF